jgi:Flp pilus assembly protein TadG
MRTQSARDALLALAPGWISVRRRLRAFGGEAGQAAIEMAFVLPLFLATVFGMMQSALLLQTYCNATYACRNAARYASIHSSTSLAPSTASQIQTMVQTGLFLNASIRPTITVSYLNPNNFAVATNTVGNLVNVKATWGQSMVIPFMNTGSFTVTTQTYKMISR